VGFLAGEATQGELQGEFLPVCTALHAEELKVLNIQCVMF